MDINAEDLVAAYDEEIRQLQNKVVSLSAINKAYERRINELNQRLVKLETDKVD